MWTKPIAMAVVAALLAGCAATRMQVITSWKRPNHLTRSEHAVLVKTCDLVGAKAALAYKKRHPPPYKDKFEKSPLSKARFGAVDNCAKRHGLKVKRRYRYR